MNKIIRPTPELDPIQLLTLAMKYTILIHYVKTHALHLGLNEGNHILRPQRSPVVLEFLATNLARMIAMQNYEAFCLVVHSTVLLCFYN